MAEQQRNRKGPDGREALDAARTGSAERTAVLDAICLTLGHGQELVDWQRWRPQDWADLGELAELHGVAPLLFREFSRAGWPQSAPAGIRDRLRNNYYQSAGRNALLLHDLEQVIGLLERASVPVVLLKGSALAVDLYEDTALRPMGDADLLVPREMLHAAGRVVEAAGYRRDDLGLSDALAEMVVYEANYDLRSGTNSAFRLELHWDLIGGSESVFRPDIDWFWTQVLASSPDADKAQKTAGRLTPTAHLLYLCAHLMLKHDGIDDRLLWGYDLCLLVREWGDRIDWRELIDRARQFGWDAALFGALLGISRRFGSPVPPEVLDELEVSLAASDVAFLQRKVVMRGRWQETRAYLHTLGRQARIRYVLGLVFPGKQFMCQRYAPRPRWIWPLYYPYRWADIALDGARAWRSWRESQGRGGELVSG